MLKTPLLVESYGLSDVGISRPNNEDAWAMAGDGQFFALADGMGGHPAGEVAAHESISHLCSFMDGVFSLDKKFSIHELMAALSQGIRETNHKVHTLSLQQSELAGMGTTLSCFLLYEHILLTAHVGDSRIYRYRSGLDQLSIDHTARVEKASTIRKMITRAVGTGPHVEPDLEALPILSEDTYFLCSDGLSDYVTSDEMCLILRKTPTIQEACSHLITAAKTKGSTDNITIVMIKTAL